MSWWQWLLLNPGWYLGSAMALSELMRRRDLARAPITQEDGHAQHHNAR